MNILFVCSRNKRRSRTAEKIFRNDQRFFAKSAGFSKKSPVKISEKLIFWADLIMLMEYEHSKRFNELYRHIDTPKIEILEIEDRFEFMDEELIEVLNDKTNEILKLFADETNS